MLRGAASSTDPLQVARNTTALAKSKTNETLVRPKACEAPPPCDAKLKTAIESWIEVGPEDYSCRVSASGPPSYVY